MFHICYCFAIAVVISIESKLNNNKIKTKLKAIFFLSSFSHSTDSGSESVNLILCLFITTCLSSNVFNVIFSIYSYLKHCSKSISTIINIQHDWPFNIHIKWHKLFCISNAVCTITYLHLFYYMKKKKTIFFSLCESTI